MRCALHVVSALMVKIKSHRGELRRLQNINPKVILLVLSFWIYPITFNTSSLTIERTGYITEQRGCGALQKIRDKMMIYTLLV